MSVKTSALAFGKVVELVAASAFELLWEGEGGAGVRGDVFGCAPDLYAEDSTACAGLLAIAA